MNIHPESGTNGAGDLRNGTLGEIGADKMALDLTRRRLDGLTQSAREQRERAGFAEGGVEYLATVVEGLTQENEELRNERDGARRRAGFAEGVISRYNPEHMAKRYIAASRIASRREARANRFSIRAGRAIDTYTQRVFTGVGTFISRVRTGLIRALEAEDSNQYLQ